MFYSLINCPRYFLQFNSRTLDDLKGIPTGTEITEVDGLPCS